MQIIYINPNKESKVYRVLEKNNPVTHFMINKKFYGSKPRIDAPGLLYYNLETRAKKQGIETKEIDIDAIKLHNAVYTQKSITLIREQMGILLQHYEQVKKKYKDRGTAVEKERFQRMEHYASEYIGCFQEYLKEMEDFVEQMLQGFPQEVVQKVREQDEKEVFLKYAEKERSREWIRNSLQERIRMLIGGKKHTESLYGFSKEYGCSIISLKPFSDKEREDNF